MWFLLLCWFLLICVIRYPSQCSLNGMKRNRVALRASCKKGNDFKNIKYIIRPDILPVPEIEEPKSKKWTIVLTLVLLLTFSAILSAVMTFQLKKEDNEASNLQNLPSTKVRTTTARSTDQTSSIATTDAQSTPAEQRSSIGLISTKRVPSTPTVVSDQNKTTVLQTTADVRSTSIPLSDQNLTIATTDIESTTTVTITTVTSDQSSTLRLQTTTEVRSTSTPLSKQDSTIATAPTVHSSTLGLKSTDEVSSIPTVPSDQSSTTGLQTTSESLSTLIPIFDQNTTIGSRGKRFIVLFMSAHKSSTERKIYITSDNGVKMNIITSENLDPSLKTQIDRMVDLPSSYLITLPREMELNSFQKQSKAILLETSADVFVISQTEGPYTVGSTTHIPLHQLSTKYVIVSTEPRVKSQFAVAAIENNTLISVTFKMKRSLPLDINGTAFYSTDVFNISLDRFETYQIAHGTDLTGTVIESSYPIAAFSGNECNRLENIGACDYFIEQLPSIGSVDKTYVVPPNLDDRDTLIRITALEYSNITYTINTSNLTVFLVKYDTFDTKISSNQTCFIESQEPALVTMFGLHSKSSGLGDPSMTIVPGVNQYLNYYKVVIPPGSDNNYVSIMMKYSSKDFLRINGTEVTVRDVLFEDILGGFLKYSVRVINVTEGELTASTIDGERFGMICTGVSPSKAYGFSGNSLLLYQT